MRGFGHAICLDDRRAENVFERGHDLRRQRCRRGTNEAKRRRADDIAIARGARQDRLVHGRNGCVPGRSKASSHSKNLSASNPGAQMTLAPAVSEARTAADRAHECEREASHSGSGPCRVRSSVAAMWLPEAHSWRGSAATILAATWCQRCAGRGQARSSATTHRRPSRMCSMPHRRVERGPGRWGWQPAR